MVFAILLPVLGLTGCGIRHIAKQPVSKEDLYASYRAMGQGDRLIREGKDHLALVKYLEAARFNPYHEAIFNKLAIAYSRLQMYYQAKKAVERSLGLNDKYAYAYNTAGIIHLAQFDNDKAIKLFKKALRLRPGFANFYVNLGYAQIQKGQFKRGLESYRKALELDPDVLSSEKVIQLTYAIPESADPIRLYQMARLFAQLGDKQNCLMYLEKALAAGFDDQQRLMSDKSFEKLRKDPDFNHIIDLYGLGTPRHVQLDRFSSRYH